MVISQKISSDKRTKGLIIAKKNSLEAHRQSAEYYTTAEKNPTELYAKFSALTIKEPSNISIKESTDESVVEEDDQNNSKNVKRDCFIESEKINNEGQVIQKRESN